VKYYKKIMKAEIIVNAETKTNAQTRFDGAHRGQRLGGRREEIFRTRFSASCLALCLCAAALFFLVFASPASATVSQDDVFRSLTQNMDEQPDYWKLLPWFLAAAGVVAIVIFVRQRQRLAAVPRVVNHPGKLLREVIRTADLDPSEVKELKARAAELNCENPLTLLLCPSLLAKPAVDEKIAEQADSAGPQSDLTPL